MAYEIFLDNSYLKKQKLYIFQNNFPSELFLSFPEKYPQQTAYTKDLCPLSALLFYWMKENGHLTCKNGIISMGGGYGLKNKSVRSRNHTVSSDKR